MDIILTGSMTPPLGIVEMFRFYKLKLSNWFSEFTTPKQYSASDCKSIEELRNYAHSIMRTDPGFAEDIFAACYRAELEQQA